MLPLSTVVANGGQFATVSPTRGGTDIVNRGYAGFKWTFGKTMTPELVLGFRHAQVDANGDTDGGDISFSFGILDGITAGKFRTKYFNGNETIQAEIGAGYDFTNGFFTGAGFNLPYASTGVDYLLSSDLPSQWQPNFILHTQTDYERKSTTTTTLSCVANFTLVNGTCQSDG